MSQSPAPLHAVVVANGQFPYPARQVALVRGADLVIAADGGANWLHAQGLGADLVVGDLDSAAPAALAALRDGGARLLRHPAHKDETDTELALSEAVRLGAGRITLLGATGGRLDHTLANVLLLAMPALAGREVRLFDGCAYASLVREAADIRGGPGDLVSLLPLGGDAEGVRTEGLEYPLRGETLRFGPARGVSNVFLGDTARVTLTKGLLLLIHTPLAHLEED